MAIVYRDVKGSPLSSDEMDANFQELSDNLAILVNDTAYAGSWNGVTSEAPSKNAVYDLSLQLTPLDGSRPATKICVGAADMGLAPFEVTGSDATTNTSGVATSYGGFFFTNNVDTTLLVRTLGSGHVQIATDQAGRFISFAVGLFQEALRLNTDRSATFYGPIGHASYTVGTAPDPTLYEGSSIYVTDEVGGKVMAFSDGVNWRRYTDRAIISI